MQHRRRVRVLAIHPSGLLIRDVPRVSAILGVSLANPTFASPSLPPLLDWAALHFDKLVILLGDYLERHNITISDPAAAADAAMEKGRKLRSYIEDCISQFSPGQFVLESAYDLAHEASFTGAYTLLKKHFETDHDFKETVMADVDAYLSRKPLMDHKTKEESVRRSIAYILEELVLFSQLIDRGHRVQVYPGRHLRIFRSLASKELITPLKGLNSLICIDVHVGH
jgi:tRNA-dependent cyclodipeptide synthase